MFNYIFRQKDVTIEDACQLIEKLRSVIVNLDIWEFEWVNYQFYVSIRCTEETAAEIKEKFAAMAVWDMWDIQYDD